MDRRNSNSSIISVEDERQDIMDFSEEKSGYIEDSFSSDNIEDLVSANSLSVKSRENYMSEENTLSVSSADTSKSTVADDPVKVYLREIGRIKLLSTADEIRLAKEIMEGGTKGDIAKKKLTKIFVY